MVNQRNSYWIRIIFNGVWINEIVIDSHYLNRHSDHMSDELIMKMIQKIGGLCIEADSINGDYIYYKIDPLLYNEKLYRLIFVMEAGKNYIGVINAFRR